MIESRRIAGIVAPDIRMLVKLLMGTLEIVHTKWTQPQSCGFQNAHDRARFPSLPDLVSLN